MRRILAIDGGGIKGAIPAAFLAEIEDALGSPLANYFDLVVGTSTGGIIALAIALGVAARRIVQFYVEDGPMIFQQDSASPATLSWLRKFGSSLRRVRTSKYESDGLRRALNGAFGSKKLGESSVRLVIPSFDLQRREVHNFKTAHAPRLEFDYKVGAVEVALATAAAPTYFPAHQLPSGITLFDGGVWANNPVAVAVVEAIAVLGWPAEDLRVLTLGCSEEVVGFSKRSGLAGMALQATDLFMLGQSRGAVGMARLLTRDSADDRRVFRYEHYVEKGVFALDRTERVADLRGIGAGMARQELHHLRDVFFTTTVEKFTPFYPVVFGSAPDLPVG